MTFSGVIFTAGPVTAVPESVTDACALPGNDSSRLALGSPVWVGVNAIVTAHDVPAASVCPVQESAVSVNSDRPTPAIDAVTIGLVTWPGLVTVKTWPSDVSPMLV